MASLPELDVLWREVRAQPDDDGVLAVLGDALQAAGDPRGELIALQLAVARGMAGYDAARRIAHLLAMHGNGWLGPLRPIVARAQFVRGVVRRIELAEKAPEGRAWERCLEAPALATIEAIARGRGAPATYAKLVTSPLALGLREVEVFDPESLRALETTPLSFERISVILSWPQSPTEYVEQLRRRVLPACERHALFSTLGVPAWSVDAIRDTPAIARLRELVIGGTLREGVALWPRLPRALVLTIVPRVGVEECGATSWDSSVSLSTIDRRVTARLAGTWLLQSISDAIAMLPPEVSLIAVTEANTDLEARAREAARRRGADLITIPPSRGHVLQLP